MSELAALRAKLTPLGWGVLWDPFHQLYRAVNAFAYVQAATADELRTKIHTIHTDTPAKGRARSYQFQVGAS